MKVLLFANIGSAPNKFYHVGDEAMFLETHRWYKKHHPKTKISILTSKPNHAHLKINEIISPIEFQYVNKIFLFRFIVYYLLYKITKINRLSKQENELIYVIKKQDRIHLCGGGNLTSVYPDWLYYSFLVLITAILLSKEIIITSQTIGPFNKVDKLLSFFILNKAKIIAVRGHADTIKNLGIYKRNIYNMLDAAYLLPSAKIESKKDPGEIIIGLSLHDWSKSEFFYSSLVKAISSVAKSYKIKLLLIPHVIVDNEDQWDMGFMKNLFFSKNSGISVIKPEISEILGHKPEPAYYIKGLTKSVNFIISTRYHGLIFALSENIPALTFTSDSYYSDKNTNAIKIYYPNNYKKFIFSIKDASSARKIKKSIIKMILEHNKESHFLKTVNRNLLKNYDLFCNNLGQEILK